MSSAVRLLLIVIWGWASVGFAQADDQAPPARAGRVSVIDGNMTVKAADDQDWSAAVVNYPVAPGMQFATAPGSRAELQFGDIVVRLDGRTALSVLALDDQTTAMRIDDGSISVRARILFDDERIDVEAAHGTAHMLQPGAYRVDAGVGSDPSRFVVFQGRGQLETSRGREDVRVNDAVEANPAGRVRHVPAEKTSVDDWADMREKLLADSMSQRYVGAGVPGYEDLDDTGAWQDSPDYGPVWYPSDVPNGWEPYTDGSWAWVAPWGWTWIDAAPWGFAPFHYGRWVFLGGRWAWCPGERLSRPVYAPALVGFVGSAPWRFASRNVRPDHWVPLAPGEIYQAPYTRNAAYLREINRGSAPRDVIEHVDWQHLSHGDLANGNAYRGGLGNTGASDQRRNPIVITDPHRPRGGYDNRGTSHTAAPDRHRQQSEQQPGLGIEPPPTPPRIAAPVMTAPNPVSTPPNPVTNPNGEGTRSPPPQTHPMEPARRSPSAEQGNPGQGPGH